MWWKTKNHLDVRGNRLTIADIDAGQLAKKYSTPLYVYDANRILENFQRMKNTFEKFDSNVRIHYAMKANPHFQILKLLLNEGAWIDAVSPNEAKLALAVGYPKKQVLFTGTSVSNSDLQELMRIGVRINIDSFSQMKRMAKMGFQGDASIRWNPGIGAGLHSHTITAGKYIKFGIPEEKILSAFEEAKKLGFNIVGLHQHIGSGWLGGDVDKFLETANKTIETAKKAQEILGKNLEFVDFGGGPGIKYKEEQLSFPLELYARGIAKRMQNSGLKAETAIEPGRYLVGDAGVLLLEANTVEEKNISIIGVDAGFNALIRPAFYGAYHEILNASNVSAMKLHGYMVAGNLCESSDVFNKSKEELRELPTTQEGDIIAILNAGAYGMSMASNYNLRARPAEAMIFKGKDYLITERETTDDVVKKQRKDNLF